MSGHETLEKYREILGSVWSGEAMRPYINEGKLESEQVQPNGIDLTVDKVFIIVGEAILSRFSYNSRRAEVIEKHSGRLAGLAKVGWFLNPGYYVIEWSEHVKIPDNAIGLINPRSTLIRSGGTIYGALWDRGYHGKGRSGLILYNHLLFEQGTRLAQIVFINATDTGEAYDGQYQHEQLNQDATEKKESDTKEESE